MKSNVQIKTFGISIDNLTPLEVLNRVERSIQKK